MASKEIDMEAGSQLRIVYGTCEYDIRKASNDDPLSSASAMSNPQQSRSMVRLSGRGRATNE